MDYIHKRIKFSETRIQEIWNRIALFISNKIFVFRYIWLILGDNLFLIIVSRKYAYKVPPQTEIFQRPFEFIVKN